MNREGRRALAGAAARETRSAPDEEEEEEEEEEPFAPPEEEKDDDRAAETDDDDRPGGGAAATRPVRLDGGAVPVELSAQDRVGRGRYWEAGWWLWEREGRDVAWEGSRPRVKEREEVGKEEGGGKEEEESMSDTL